VNGFSAKEQSGRQAKSQKLSGLKNIAFKLLVLVSFVLTTATALAQKSPNSNSKEAPGNSQSRAAFNGPRKHMATILFCGLGGAILGLSTLSFYGRPQDNLNNITIGFAIGIIAGTTVVTYQAVTRPTEFYGNFMLDRPIYEQELQQAQKIASLGGLQSLRPINLNWSF
jgi:hypothetical protein